MLVCPGTLMGLELFVYQNVRVWLPQSVSRGSTIALDSVRDSVSKNNVESDWPRCLMLTSGLHTYVLAHMHMHEHIHSHHTHKHTKEKSGTRLNTRFSPHT